MTNQNPSPEGEKQEVTAFARTVYGLATGVGLPKGLTQAKRLSLIARICREAIPQTFEEETHE
jgi:hypothetical protein